MKRNPIIPFVLIMVFGIVLTLVLSFKGLGDAKEMAKGTTSGTTGTTTQATATNPQDIYKTTCIACHGDQYQGVVGPSLHGIGKKLSVARIKQIITQGYGPMPSGLVSPQQADAMAKWVSQIK